MKTTVVHPDRGLRREIATNFARDCALETIATLRRRGADLRVVTGPQMVHGNIIRILRPQTGQDGDFLAFGHGDPDQLFGYHGACALHKDDSHLLANKVCYVLACFSFSGIGTEAISSGAKAFIGFREAFIVPRHFRDEMKQCVTSGILAYLRGEIELCQVEEVTRTKFDSVILRLSSRSFREAVPSVLAFSHNEYELSFYVRP